MVHRLRKYDAKTKIHSYIKGVNLYRLYIYDKYYLWK